jgi:hypothetical protein
MLGASKMFWQEHQRCIAFVLLYRLDRSHWSIELPSQSCRHDLAKWSPALSAPIDAHDGYALAGTFQSRILPKDPDLLTIAPDDPGLHFFYNPGSRRIDVRAALRYTDPALATRVIDPTHVIEDDKAALLESARDRLELV